jgi:hypothetical protein
VGAAKITGRTNPTKPNSILAVLPLDLSFILSSIRFFFSQSFQNEGTAQMAQWAGGINSDLTEGVVVLVQRIT